MATVTVTKDNIDALIEDNTIVILDFWAEWCGPCKQFAPTFEQASTARPNIVFGKVDTEAQPELAKQFNIRSIPTLIAFKEQTGVFAQPGSLPRAQLDELVDHIETLNMDTVRAAITKQQTPR